MPYPQQSQAQKQGNKPQYTAVPLPASDEAEMSLLASLLIRPDAIAIISDLIIPEDFYFPKNKLVAQVIWELFDNNSKVDSVIVHEELVKRKRIEEVGGTDYFFKIEEAVPDADNAEHYAKIIKENSLRRKLLGASYEIIEDTRSSSDPIEHILDRAENKLFNIAQTLKVSNAVKVGERVSALFETLEKTVAAGGKAITGIPTGFDDLDRLTSGLQPSELIVLAARPSQGKTTLALNISWYAALHHSIPVAFFSLESSTDQLILNIISSHAQINTQKMRTGFMSKEEWYKLGMAGGALSEVNLFIDDTIPLPIFMLKSKARRLKIQHDIKLIVVDYLQHLDAPLMPGVKYQTEEQRVSIISKQLKALAKELKIPILAIAQLNREPENRKDSEPKLSDLRSSGQIEQDADVVLMLWRKDPEKPETILKLEKQRNGPTGKVKLQFFKQFLAFHSASCLDASGEDFSSGASDFTPDDGF